MKYLAPRLLASLLTFVIGTASFTVLHAYHLRSVLNSPDGQAIMQVEHEYIEANLSRDTATLDKILADEFTIGTRWRIETKYEWLDELDNSDSTLKAIHIDYADVDVNGDTAVVRGKVYTQTSQGDVEFISPTYRFTRNFEKRDGRWQIVSVRIGRR
ncbi:MAG TPA: nuclear transport factor 2 family protein [Pyrinomonadaceae bacterium]|nr:nuclear transport factor 2 family protein [Pyrinomonadaceae bacterium]